jgi:hypothetical protein
MRKKSMQTNGDTKRVPNIKEHKQCQEIEHSRVCLYEIDDGGWISATDENQNLKSARQAVFPTPDAHAAQRLQFVVMQLQ